MTDSRALVTIPNLEDPDGFYQKLIEMHRDLSPAQSDLANAKLILLLANHVGDHGILCEAIRQATAGLSSPEDKALAPE